jgi:hypothetical protein
MVRIKSMPSYLQPVYAALPRPIIKKRVSFHPAKTRTKTITTDGSQGVPRNTASTGSRCAVAGSICETAIAEANSNKTVVEEVTGWIRIYSDGTVERLTPPGGEPFTAIIPPYAEPRDGLTVHDISTGRGVDVRLYLPELASHSFAPYRRRPILVHFHGGGFCVSRPSWALYHNFYAPLAANLPVAVTVSVYLPLAPEHRLPAAIDAGHDALLWLRDVACGKTS